MVVPLTPPGDLTHFMAVQHLAMQNVAAPGMESMSAYRGHVISNDAERILGDGVVMYSPDLAGTLERMLDDNTRHRQFDLRDPGDVADLIGYKRALFTVGQRNAELLVPAGHRQHRTPVLESPAVPPEPPRYRYLEQSRPELQYVGRTHLSGRNALDNAFGDTWCLRNADAYNDQFDLSFADDLRQIDLGRLAKETDFRWQVSGGMDAAEALTGRLAERSGLSHDQVLDELNRQDADGKVERIAGWMLKTEPHDLRKEDVERIGDALDREFGTTHRMPHGPTLLSSLDHTVGKIVQDRQTMSIGLPPPATGTVSIDPTRPTTGARTTTPAPRVVREQ